MGSSPPYQRSSCLSHFVRVPIAIRRLYGQNIFDARCLTTLDTGCYMWLLVPEQPDPRQPLSWSEMKLQGSNGLAGRASRTLINKGLLAVNWGGSLLRMDVDKVPLWRGNHVPVKQLAEDIARYVYLTRLKIRMCC